jgi:hypothetical protein
VSKRVILSDKRSKSTKGSGSTALEENGKFTILPRAHPSRGKQQGSLLKKMPNFGIFFSTRDAVNE